MPHPDVPEHTRQAWWIRAVIGASLAAVAGSFIGLIAYTHSSDLDRLGAIDSMLMRTAEEHGKSLTTHTASIVAIAAGDEAIKARLELLERQQVEIKETMRQNSALLQQILAAVKERR